MDTEAPQSHRMPVLYLSHGAPPLADDEAWTAQLSAWSSAIQRPRAVLMVSAHWEESPLTLGATSTRPLVYDFWGFPERYYQVEYPAPGAPELAADVRKLLHSPEYPVHTDETRGLDHGAYVPLVEMYPDADVPVLQVSMPTLAPETLLRLGRGLRPLRDDGVLIVGSGFTTHNLHETDMSRGSDVAPPSWSSEFDDWVDHAVAARDVDGLLDFEHKAPAARRAHPRSDHFAPLFIALGASIDDLGTSEAVIDGYWYGLAKRSFQFD